MKLTVILVIAAACGGNQRTEATPPADPQPAEPPAPEPPLDQRMNDYGLIMYGYWPAKPSPSLMKEVCDNIARITDAGLSLGAALRMRPNAGIGSLGAALQIERSVNDLARACGDANRAAFDSALTTTQSAYEKVAAINAPRYPSQ